LSSLTLRLTGCFHSPASLHATHSLLSKTIESSTLEKSIETLLHVDDGEKGRADDFLIGVTGAADTRESSPKGTKRQSEAMKFELDQLHAQALAEKKRRRLSAKQSETSSSEPTGSSSSGTPGRVTLKDNEELVDNSAV
jgi:hypothetical protein